MATMQEVATHAGVSIATVSFVVNGTKKVSPATRERVQASMTALGFRNNAIARALASKRTRIIALLIPALEHRMGATTLEFFTSAAARASELGYHLVLWPDEPTGDELTELLSSGLVDGVILMEVRMEDPRIERLTELRVPFTSIGRTRDPSGLPFVDIDFETTVRRSLDYLESLGHRRFGLVIEDLTGTPMEGYAPLPRTEETFRSECAARGLVGTVVNCGSSAPGGRKAASDLLAADPDVTAVMIMKDDSTFGLVSGLTSAGRRVPEDVSVLSVASSTAAGAQHDPPLTTMNSPGRELGRLAAEELINQLDGPVGDLPHVLLPCVLHEAGSTGPAPHAHP
ncbi:Catabolite control protein A [Frondihabitans sp. 762G35]|uniref:LacI family DNA-binding transcriptional regulator n=1 Tax=Frondihabitans sp. 762G35 TaxID=1446794 RepID=UPI000D21611D|nr:LacI family DNA-binding transcriptional regulator [Frondihabitans sp. 762G35]ARC58181.1 Catabolite control protein A [Frondihabitans sp. 762G35]